MNIQSMPADASEFLLGNQELRVVLNTAGVLMAANTPFSKAMKRDSDEIVGTYIWDLVHPDCVEQTLEMLNQLCLFGATNDFVCCLLTPRREQVWMHWSCSGARKDGLLFASADVIDPPERRVVCQPRPPLVELMRANAWAG